MNSYKSIPETMHHPEIGTYTSYGIAAYDQNGHLRCLVPDVFPDQKEADAFAARCTAEQVEWTQLMDVIEDTIGIPSAYCD